MYIFFLETPESIIHNQDFTECYGEMLPPNCNPDCKLCCYYTFPSPQRREIYKEFQLLHDVIEQNCRIAQLVNLRMIKKNDSTFYSAPVYYLVMNEKSLVKVCRTFFMNTLGLPENRLNAVLKPVNYSWYSDRDTALKSNQPRHVNIINESIATTNFMKESLILLEKDYNLVEPESTTKVQKENIPFKEYGNILKYMKSIPRVLSSYQMPENLKKQFFETSICMDYMYTTYSEDCIKNKNPPCTIDQFRKIYNDYMKKFLKMI